MQSNTVLVSVGVTVLPMPDLSGIDGKTFALTDEISFNYPVSGVSFQWLFTSASSLSSSPAAAGNDGFGGVRPMSASEAATTSAPKFTPASAGITPGAYQLTVTVTQGNQSQSATATITLVSADLSAVRVYPNPWRSDKHAGKSIVFDELPANCKVEIFTTSGHKAREFDNVNESISWDLTNDSGDKVASGIYVYLITDGQGDKIKGKVAIIK